MGKYKRGHRDGTGPYKYSYAKKSGRGGSRERCYEKPKKRRR